MVWVERFDGRLERAGSLNAALAEPVRAWCMEGRPRSMRARGAAPGMDPAPIRGVPGELLAAVVVRPAGESAGGRRTARRGSVIERALGLARDDVG